MRIPIQLEEPHTAPRIARRVEVALPLGDGDGTGLKLVGEDLSNNGRSLLRGIALCRGLQLHALGRCRRSHCRPRQTDDIANQNHRFCIGFIDFEKQLHGHTHLVGDLAPGIIPLHCVRLDATGRHFGPCRGRRAESQSTNSQSDCEKSARQTHGGEGGI